VKARLIGAVLALGLAGALATAAFAATAAGTKRAASVKVGVSLAGYSTDFWSSYVAFEKAAATKYGVSLVGPISADGDAGKQATQIRQLITQGVNEVLAVVLLAAKFGVPICPHAGGVGLCEYAQHVSMFDYVAVGATFDDRVCEFVDHLHEHFVDPVRVARGRYLAPTTPGYSIEIRPESLSEFAFPDGPGWWKEEEVPA